MQPESARAARTASVPRWLNPRGSLEELECHQRDHQKHDASGQHLTLKLFFAAKLDQELGIDVFGFEVEVDLTLGWP